MGILVYSLYFALGPVYWLPGISPVVMQAVKLSLFGLITLRILYVWSRRNFAVHKVSLALFTGLIFVLCISFLAHGAPPDELSDLVSFLIPMAVLCITSASSASEQQRIANGLLKAPVYFACIASLVPLALIFPSLAGENPFYQANDFFGLTQTFTGFGGSRTGWALGGSFISALALTNFVLATTRKRKIYSALIFLIISAAIFIPAGRVGIVTTAVMLATLALLGLKNGKIGRKTTFAMLLLLLILIGVVLYFAEELRFSVFLTSSLADASTGRTDGYRIALDLINENPALGVGIQKSDLKFYGVSYSDIHNTNLNFAVRYGLIAVIAAFSIFGYLIHRMLFVSHMAYRHAPILAAIMTMVAACTITFFEPYVVFGSFHTSIVFWFAMAVFLGYRRQLREQRAKMLSIALSHPAIATRT